MLTRHAINWAAAALLALLLGTAHMLDGPSDHDTALAVAADVQAAIETEAANARFTGAATQLCGNATWTVDADGAVHCHLRRPLHLRRASL